MNDSVANGPEDVSTESNDNNVDETGDPGVPTDLLDLYVALEDEGLTPDDLKKELDG